MRETITVIEKFTASTRNLRPLNVQGYIRARFAGIPYPENVRVGSINEFNAFLGRNNIELLSVWFPNRDVEGLCIGNVILLPDDLDCAGENARGRDTATHELRHVMQFQVLHNQDLMRYLSAYACEDISGKMEADASSYETMWALPTYLHHCDRDISPAG